MRVWKSFVYLVAFVLARPAIAQSQISQLTQFQNGQVASATAVNDNFRTLLVQTVKLQRPALLRKPNAPQTIVIPATTNKPGRVAIGNVVLNFTQDIEIDLTASGRGGIDTGVVQASRLYYVYVVFGNGGPPAVAATASLNPPAQGPDGFDTNWTYLGSMLTSASSQVLPFRYDRGQYSTWGSAGFSFGTLATVVTQLDLPVPAFASSMDGLFSFAGAITAGNTARVGPESSGILPIVIAPSSNQGLYFCASIPLLEPSRIYWKVDNAGNDLQFRLLGVCAAGDECAATLDLG